MNTIRIRKKHFDLISRLKSAVSDLHSWEAEIRSKLEEFESGYSVSDIIMYCRPGDKSVDEFYRDFLEQSIVG